MNQLLYAQHILKSIYIYIYQNSPILAHLEYPISHPTFRYRRIIIEPVITIIPLKSNIHLRLPTTKLINKPFASIEWHCRILLPMEQPNKRRQLRGSRNILNRKHLGLPAKKIEKFAILDNSYCQVVSVYLCSFLESFIGGDDSPIR